MDNIIYESERLLIKPLSIKKLLIIINNKAELLETPVLSEALSDVILTAITKKIEKMRDIKEEFHVWYTYWLIIDKENSNGIGFVGFKGINQDGYAEVGYSISPSFRKRGLMTEALNALIKWAYENKNLRGITATVKKTNIGSLKVLQNCGFKVTDSSEQEVYYCLKFR